MAHVDFPASFWKKMVAVLPGGLGIAAAIVLSAGLAVAREQKPDLILYNGKIVTVDGRFSIAEAVAINGGTITKVGSNGDVRALADSSTRQVDLKGRMVTPGFIDAHTHLAQLGSKLYAQADLSRAASIAEIKKRIAAQVRKTPPDEWVSVSSLGDPPPIEQLPGALHEKRWPTRHDLDEVAPHNPVMIPTPWGGPNPAILNTSALLRLGITKDTPANDQGIIIGKDAHGEPTGIIERLHVYYYGPYVAKLMEMLPDVPIDDQARGVAKQIQVANATGITAIDETHFITPDNIKVCSIAECQ